MFPIFQNISGTEIIKTAQDGSLWSKLCYVVTCDLTGFREAYQLLPWCHQVILCFLHFELRERLRLRHGFPQPQGGKEVLLQGAWLMVTGLPGRWEAKQSSTDARGCSVGHADPLSTWGLGSKKSHHSLWGLFQVPGPTALTFHCFVTSSCVWTWPLQAVAMNLTFYSGLEKYWRSFLKSCFSLHVMNI